MAFAITQSCCSDASCVAVCPVNCIHPTPDEPDFATTEMLYIDPRSCIDCGACADACPVDAIFPVDHLLQGQVGQRDYPALNAEHFADVEPVGGAEGPWGAPVYPASLTPAASGLRVAIVGTGPSAGYAAAALLTTSAEVTLIDRLAVPGGLVRFGVAPDHLATRAIAERFATVYANPRLHLVLGVEVGEGPGRLTHTDLMAHHDAVLYAVGARADRTLGVPGEDLPGSLAARTFVGWYNAHPDVAPDAVDLRAVGAGENGGASGRAVVVGNGNVALDAARVLLGDPDRLEGTAVSRSALAALRGGHVREVVLIGRRGPDDAAYSLSELRPLLADPHLDVVVDGGSAEQRRDLAALIAAAPAGSKAAALRDVPILDRDLLDLRGPAPGRRRLVLRFGTEVREVHGADRVEEVVVAGADRATPKTPERIRAGLLLRSVGYRSEPVPGLPFDEVTHTVPHAAGRVLDPATGRPVPGSYVVGWIKRGPRGGIGANRLDAAETVAAIVDDANAGLLRPGRGSVRSFARLVRERAPDAATGRDAVALARPDRARRRG